MQAHQEGPIYPEGRCNRCKRSQPTRLSIFGFRHSFAYWKERYELETGKRLTRRRQRALGEAINFDWKHPPAYYLELCPECWSECREPWDGFPMQFYEQIILEERPVAETLVAK